MVIEISLLVAFIPTFFLVAFSPGMCMTLALTLGMTIGVRRSLYMMYGELIGVGLVSLTSVLGAATLMNNYPWLFQSLKYAGGLYLLYLGIELWRSRGKLAITELGQANFSRRQLFSQGFITAIANPKGWAFMIALLPPFINPNFSLPPQLMILISIILLSEFSCMLIYATGGKGLRQLLQKSNNLTLINRITGSLMIAIAIWLFRS